LRDFEFFMSEQPGTKQADLETADGVIVASRYLVMPAERLPQFDTPFSQAFATRDKRRPEKPMYALVTPRGLPPRLEALKGLARADIAALIVPQDGGVAYWPPARQERFFIVFDQHSGERVLPSHDAEITPLREEEVYRKVMRPLLAVLQDLGERVIPHRGIRADNLYYKDGNRDSTVLGECVSMPPAYAQPALYETVESAMANPGGRSRGRVSDDLYSFGVLLVVLLNGGNPCAGMSDQELIDSKIQRGTYTTLIGKGRYTLSMMEPLRGLLCDDPAERWTVDDLQFWADGRALSPKQPALPEKATRPLVFNGQSFVQAPALAHAMAKNWTKATDLIQGEGLLDWLQRCFSSNDIARDAVQRVSLALAAVSQGTRGRDYATSRTLMALDCNAPLRYKTFSAQIDALGPALAIDFQQQESVQHFGEIIEGKLPLAWLEVQSTTRPEFVPLKKQFEMVEFFLRRSGWGFGMERCLYELNPGWPCQSPLLENRLVYEVTQLLPALEKIASTRPQESDIIDAHITAFCAARIKKLPERVLNSLADPSNRAQQRVGMLRLLATVQRLLNQGPLPKTGIWLARTLSPAIESFHSRPYRHDLAIKIEEVAESGDLASLLALVDNHEARMRDAAGFENAKLEFQRATREINWLRRGGLTSAQTVRKGARQAALLISTVLSGLTLLLLTLSFAT